MRLILLGIFHTLLLGCLVQCASKPLWQRTPLAESVVHSAIIFIPGYYGSALADAQTGERIFQTFGQALWGSIPLALTEPDFGVPDARELKVDGLLESVSVVPGLYSVDGYGATMDFLSEAFGDHSQIIAFPYDWRRDVRESVHLLKRQIDELHARGISSIALVAHSFGGVLTSYYLRYGDQDFDHAVENWQGLQKVRAVVLAGVPFQGTMTPFRNIHTGTSLGTAKTPLNALSLATFPSMYQLMPGAGGFPPGVYDPKVWEEQGWGLLQKGYSENSRAQRRQFSARYLNRAQAFRNLQSAPLRRAPSSPIPALIVQGNGAATFSRASWTGRDFHSAGMWLWSSTGDPGDGTITLASSTPPEGLRAGLKSDTLKLPAEHVGMLTLSPIQAAIVDFLKAQGFRQDGTPLHK